ncbi:MAG: hypothetical protein D6758_04750 [Gammaproteobacteria bacterium]|nr:MAG: hypothetical protein D6758_04750 [Gammaproteobacteria bacterium]
MTERQGFALNGAVAFVLVVGFSLSAITTWLAVQAHTARLQQQFIEEATRQYLLIRHDLESWATAISLTRQVPGDPNQLLSKLKGPWPGTASVEWWRVTSQPARPLQLVRAAPETLMPVLLQTRLFTLDGVRSALAQSRQSRRAQLTPVTQINQGDPDYRGEVRLLHPIYLPMDETIKADDAAPLAGVLAVSLDLRAWLEHLLGLTTSGRLQTELYDLAWHTNAPVLRLGAPSPAPARASLPDWVYDNIIGLGGREWLLRFHPTPGFIESRQSPLAIVLFVAGTLITSLIALLVAPRREELTDD